MTAAITWAVLATVGAVAAWLFARRDFHWAYEGWQRACALHVDDMMAIAADRDAAHARELRAKAELAAYKANEQARTSAHMREIGIRGNKSPKRKSAVQRLQVVGKAAEINREMGR